MKERAGTQTYAQIHACMHTYIGMGIFGLSPEFRLFDGPRGHSRDSSKFGEKISICICTL